ncbi:MAG TPA: amidohydrolase family protein [Pyrinomonadaceae bacterium]|nr:amidohydrolase family protein [Pyrinomonadaceae bacterium]
MLITLRVVVLVLFSSSLTFAQGTQQRSEPIIDMHMHADPSDQFTHPNPNPVTGKDPSFKNESEHMRATFEAMRRHNIVKGVVSGPLEVVRRWYDAAPARVIASPYFEGRPDNPLPDMDALRSAYAAGWLRAMGEIGAQYAGLPADDPKLEPYFALAEKLDIPVGLHTGLGPPGTSYRPGLGNFRVTLGSPKLLENVLVRHPKLRLYIMHGGWPYLEDTKAIMLTYPQVHADLAVIDWIIPREEFHEYLRGLMRAGLGKQLMFGSDQMRWPEAIGMAIEGIESASFLTPAQKRDIFYNNAARFLGLDKK